MYIGSLLLADGPHSSTVPFTLRHFVVEISSGRLRNISADAPLWMSSVVLEELHAGADNRERAS